MLHFGPFRAHRLANALLNLTAAVATVDGDRRRFEFFTHPDKRNRIGIGKERTNLHRANATFLVRPLGREPKRHLRRGTSTSCAVSATCGITERVAQNGGDDGCGAVSLCVPGRGDPTCLCSTHDAQLGVSAIGAASKCRETNMSSKSPSTHELWVLIGRLLHASCSSPSVCMPLHSPFAPTSRTLICRSRALLSASGA